MHNSSVEARRVARRTLSGQLRLDRLPAIRPRVQVQILQDWGLRYVTVAFIWTKLNPKPLTYTRAIEARSEGDPVVYYRRRPYSLAFGLGHYTRANGEFCLLALRGKMPVDST